MKKTYLSQATDNFSEGTVVSTVSQEVADFWAAHLEESYKTEKHEHTRAIGKTAQRDADLAGG